ncbi:hypothetical protein DdX_10945 [Ditylenchus destructor]|uniref:F-box domain-containing protein n=1 Tax=Ditylenchus destructor TaxID=166010 RepID=A0AAD4MWZ4_9BILA|nr:hypothetical protein DdX_10945 [Ditylenchus destructor]
MSDIQKHSQQEPSKKLRRVEEEAAQSAPGAATAIFHPTPRIINKMSDIQKHSQQEPSKKLRRVEEEAAQSAPGAATAIFHPTPRIINKVKCARLTAFHARTRAKRICKACLILASRGNRQSRFKGAGMLLNNYYFRDIFGYFNRKDLCRLPLVCRRFKLIIDADFAEAPYFIFPYLLQFANLKYNDYYKYWRYAYTAVKWHWNFATCTTSMYTMVSTEIPQELVDLLPKLRFIRFTKNHIFFLPSRQNTKILQSVSHVWQGQDVCLKIVTPNTALVEHQHITSIDNFTGLFTNAYQICFIDHENVEHSAVLLIRNSIIAGSCNRIHILNYHNNRLQLSALDVVNFIFRPVSEHNKSTGPFLSIATAHGSTSDQFRNELFESIAQVFIKTTKPMTFEFGWFNHFYQYRLIETSLTRVINDFITRTLKHPHTDQKLCLSESEHKEEFRIRIL